jgi:hypothetical protein
LQRGFLAVFSALQAWSERAKEDAMTFKNTSSARALGALAVAWGIALAPTESRAADSIWSGAVGKILPTDETAWCAYDVTSLVPAKVTLKLQKRASNGTIVQDGYADPNTTIVGGKMQCFNQAGTFSVLYQTTPGNPTIECPASFPIGANIRCKLNAGDSSPFVYGYGTSSLGDPCSSGIAGITAANEGSYKGQITGYVADLTYQPKSGPPFPFNVGVMQGGQVYGTDMGFTFYAHGLLWSGYGDTWANASKQAVSPTGTRGSVLYYGTDLDPSNGLQFSSYVGAGISPDFFAREVIPSHHNATSNPAYTPPVEVTAIPSAGFGLKEGGKSYTVLWFDSIHHWILGGVVSNYSTLALSDVATGDIFVRGDSPTKPAGMNLPIWNPPIWSRTSSFAAGAIYQDRYNGYIYLFGQNMDTPSAPIRLAKVEAKMASILDKTKYEYWGGTAKGWEKASQFPNPLTPSELSHFGTSADLIPGNVNAGPEFSVFFDAYVNRFLMLLVRNRVQPRNNNVEVWEASDITGPWQQKSQDFGNLPHGQMSGGAFWYFYAPYTSQQMLGGGGRTVYYQLSEFNTLPFATSPYNVGLWSFDLSYIPKAGCVR